jgi:hypothetical protein
MFTSGEIISLYPLADVNRYDGTKAFTAWSVAMTALQLGPKGPGARGGAQLRADRAAALRARRREGRCFTRHLSLLLI